MPFSYIPRVKRTANAITLSAEESHFANQLGDGNKSSGVRLALRLVREHLQDHPRVADALRFMAEAEAKAAQPVTSSEFD